MPEFARGMELRARYIILAEGARGSPTRQAIDRFAFNRDDHQKYGLGVKELWQVRPEASGPVSSSTRWAGRCRTGPGRLGAVPLLRPPGLGWLRRSSQLREPVAFPFEEFQRFKTHPMIRGVFDGGRRLGYGARAIIEGGWQSVPRLTFPGGCLVGDAAGFVNVPRIKGSQNAILSGLPCAEQVFKALRARRANHEVSAYEETWRSSEIGYDLKRVRNVKPLWSRFGTLAGLGLGGLDIWTNELTGYSLFGTMRHGKPDHATLNPLDQVKPIVYARSVARATATRQYVRREHASLETHAL